MTEYLLSIYQPAGEPPPPETAEKVTHSVETFTRELRDAGALVFTGALQPPSAATVLRPLYDQVLATDGPFAEGREHLAGFWVIAVPEMRDAREWARRAARAVTLPVELRPFHARVGGADAQPEGTVSSSPAI